MTKEEIAEIRDAIEEVGLSSTKLPKKLELKIPRVKYPGVYLNIPTDLKSFKIQVYIHYASFGFLDKINTKGYNTTLSDLYKTIFIKEVKGIPSKEEVEDYLKQALEDIKGLGIVNMN